MSFRCCPFSFAIYKYLKQMSTSMSKIWEYIWKNLIFKTKLSFLTYLILKKKLREVNTYFFFKFYSVSIKLRWTEMVAYYLQCQKRQRYIHVRCLRPHYNQCKLCNVISFCFTAFLCTNTLNIREHFVDFKYTQYFNNLPCFSQLIVPSRTNVLVCIVNYLNLYLSAARAIIYSEWTAILKTVCHSLDIESAYFINCLC